MRDIIPALIPRDCEQLETELRTVRTFSGRAHIDITDGIFTKQCSWPYRSPGIYDDFDFFASSCNCLEVHLMVANPREIGLACLHTGAVQTLIFHAEIARDTDALFEMITLWRSHGAWRVGCAIALDTPLTLLAPIVPEVDFIQVMTIGQLGVQGSAQDTRALARVKEVHQLYPAIPLAVDGGVDAATIGALEAAGASRFVIGSAIMHTPHPADAYSALEKL